MSTTYTASTKLGKPGIGDQSWGPVITGDFDSIDALSPVGGLCVTTAEVPSASLNVAVAPGNYVAQDGTVTSYAGATQAIPGGVTRVLYLDLTNAGALTVATAYPTTPHIRLATVVSAAGTISSITDQRLVAQHAGQRLPIVTHLLSTATAAPTIAAGSAAGTGPTVTLTNASDLGGLITVTTGTSPGAGTLATVTFGTAFTSTPRSVVLFPAGTNAPTVATSIYCNSLGTANFTVDTTTALAAATSFKWRYVVVG